MSDAPPRISRSLARRVADLPTAVAGDLSTSGLAPPAALIEDLRRHLHAGDTHYTTRPGVVELRERIAARIRACSGPRYDPLTEIVVTASEGEAVLAVVLSLVSESRGAGGLAPARIPIVGDLGHHASLFRAFGVEPIALDVGDGADVAGDTEVSGGTDVASVHLVKSAGFGASGAPWSTVDARSIAVGNLDGLVGMDVYRIGYAAGPAAVLKAVMTWKQAFSICTAAPSQRAALWALDHGGDQP